MLYVLVLVYFLLLAHHAWQGHRQTKGLHDFYVGGRGLGGVAVGLSFFATYSSTNSFVGFAGQGFSWGSAWILIVPAVLGFSMLAWILVAPRLRRFTEALDSLTIPDFIGFRFESVTARVLSSILVVFASLLYMTAVYKGIGSLLQVFLEIDYQVSILLVFLIVMSYTAVGGFISVVKTDAMQGTVMIVAAGVLLGGTWQAASAPEAQTTVSTPFLAPGISLPFLLGVIFAATVKFLAEPRQLSRFYSLRDDRAIRTGFWVSTLSFVVVYSMLVPVGLLARHIFSDLSLDSDLVVPRLLSSPEYFSPSAAAFLMLAMIAAAMSSLDSVLLVTASTVDRDIVRVLRPRSRASGTLKSTRYYVVLFAFLTMLIALRPPGGIVALTSFSGSLYAVCFLAPILFGLYWSRGNGTTVVLSLVSGLGVLAVWTLAGLAQFLHPVFPALACSLLLYWLGSLVSRPVETVRVRELFKTPAVPDRA